MTTGTPGSRIEVASDSPQNVRLTLNPAGPGSSRVNGGWWPRSWDAAEELSALLPALEKRFGPVASVMLNRDTWTGTFRRLAFDGRAVRIGWFTSLEPALAIAATTARVRLELMVVPPAHEEKAAERALELAIEGGTASAAELLAGDRSTPTDPQNPTPRSAM